MSSTATCDVCGLIASGHHFGAVTCKACAAFFRRSLAEDKRYKCRNGGTCDVGMSKRNRCRACRMKRCLSIGMRREDNASSPASSADEMPITALASAPSSSSSASTHFMQQSTPTPMPSCSASTLPSIMSTTLTMFLNKLDGAFTSFCNSQRSLYKLENSMASGVMNPDEEPFFLIHKALHNKMEVANSSLIATLLLEQFTEFRDLDSDHRRMVYGPFASRFLNMHRCYLTSKHFPRDDDTRIALHYGYYCSLPDSAGFFGDVHNLEEIKAYLVPLHKKWRALSMKMKRLDLRGIEIAAFIAMIFYTQMETVGIAESAIMTAKEELTAMMHAEITNFYGFRRGGVRFALIVELLADLEAVVSVVADSITMSNCLVRSPQDTYMLQNDSDLINPIPITPTPL
uniref:Nuclear receptor domain-containing protein n=1 Tax=Panagrellus redivivus TaxID=6233 RepID=A0A7E4V6T9_PANRE